MSTNRELPRPLDPLFGFVSKYLDLTGDERGIIERSCSVRRCTKNEWLSASVEEDPSAYFVLSGTVVLLYALGDRELVSEIFVDGDPVIAPLSASGDGGVHRLKCLEDCSIAVTGAEVGDRMAREFPRFGEVCRLFAEERLQRSLKWNDRLRVLTPEEKYRMLLDERADLARRVPQHVLAGYLGMTPETLSRVRRRLVRG